MSGSRLVPVALRHQVGEFRITQDISMFAWITLLRATSDSANAKRVHLQVNQGISTLDWRGGGEGRNYSEEELKSIKVIAEYREDQIATVRAAESLYELGENRYLLLRLKPTHVRLLDAYNLQGEPVITADLKSEQIPVGPQENPRPTEAIDSGTLGAPSRGSK